MSLISLLVYAVVALTILAGVTIFAGSAKSDRARTGWFLSTTIFASFWALGCSMFLAFPPDADELQVHIALGMIYIAGSLLMAALLGFASWKTWWGKIMTITSLIYVAVMSALVMQDESIFFGETILSNQGNRQMLVDAWPYWSYMAYFLIDSLLVWVALLLRLKHVRSKKARMGEYVLLAGFMICGILSCVFNVIMPLYVRYDLIWVGPVALAATITAFYYASIRYRVVSVASTWLKVLSSIVLIVAGVIVYMLIFYLIFTALFKIPNPSTAILALNFLMIVIVLLLMPVLNELSANIRSMISVGQVDIAYVVKKLNHLATRNVDLRDLAGFLADHLHFTYIGFIINGRLYGSKTLAVSSEELAAIMRLKQTPAGIWQEPTAAVQKAFDMLGLRAVAELRNAKGKTFGQLVVGKPLGKASFEQRDLVQLEMIINLVATVIDSEKHLRA